MMARKSDFNGEDAIVLDANGAATIDGEMIDVTRVRVPDVITLTARLAQVLAEEADYLEAMQISRIVDLQKEKKMLTTALETIKKQMAKNPELLEEITPEERDDLIHVVRVFNEVLEENYKRLAMARAVNQHIVKAITEVVQESTRGDAYNRKGVAGKPLTDRVSVTVNEQV